MLKKSPSISKPAITPESIIVVPPCCLHLLMQLWCQMIPEFLLSDLRRRL